MCVFKVGYRVKLVTLKYRSRSSYTPSSSNRIGNEGIVTHVDIEGDRISVVWDNGTHNGYRACTITLLEESDGSEDCIDE